MAAKEPPDPLVVAIGDVCRAAREAAGVKQVRVAAHVDVDQSTLARFERGGGWPRHPKSVGLYLRAYAEELNLDPAEILHAAVDRWAALDDGEGGSNPLSPAEVAEAAARRTQGQPSATGSTRGGKKRSGRAA